MCKKFMILSISVAVAMCGFLSGCKFGCQHKKTKPQSSTTELNDTNKNYQINDGSTEKVDDSALGDLSTNYDSDVTTDLKQSGGSGSVSTRNVGKSNSDSKNVLTKSVAPNSSSKKGSTNSGNMVVKSQSGTTGGGVSGKTVVVGGMNKTGGNGDNNLRNSHTNAQEKGSKQKQQVAKNTSSSTAGKVYTQDEVNKLLQQQKAKNDKTVKNDNTNDASKNANSASSFSSSSSSSTSGSSASNNAVVDNDANSNPKQDVKQDVKQDASKNVNLEAPPTPVPVTN